MPSFGPAPSYPASKRRSTRTANAIPRRVTLQWASMTLLLSRLGCRIIFFGVQEWGFPLRGGIISVTAIGLILAACAGRDPQPMATVQPQDMYSDCAQISAEIQANNAKVKQLADSKAAEA